MWQRACRLGDEISISIEVELPDGQRRAAYARTFFVDELANNWPVRDRNYDLAQLLQHPYTGRPCQVTEPDVGSPAPICYLIAGTPHFHPRWDLPAVRLLEDSVTHPWGEKTCQLISELTSNELFLDFGAGMKRPADLLPNAVLLDAIHFPNIDVVNSAEKIPFKPGSFDLVISQAVFEHLPNPFQSANEIFRVLKPGGKVLIDTGFMVPFHADPDHYFNMTIEGLRKVMERFEIIQLFVQPYMMPSDGLVLQIDTVLPLMRAGVWRERLQTLLDDLRREGRELDRDLGLLGQRMIAAGVSVIARKPVC